MILCMPILQNTNIAATVLKCIYNECNTKTQAKWFAESHFDATKGSLVLFFVPRVSTMCCSGECECECVRVYVSTSPIKTQMIN